MKVIIPAYEPDKNLITLIKDIKENSDYDIVIVDDGSTQNCRYLFLKARSEGCTVLTHETNLGKGAALKTALSYVLKEGTEKTGVVCADCDGQHTWQDIIKIAEQLPWHRNSIIMGSREFEGNIPLRSMIGNKLTRLVFSLISGNKISDTQTGLRGFAVEMLPWLIQLKGNRYEYEMNQLLEAASAGFTLFSVPIKTIYENNNKSSHFRPIRDSIKIYFPILKFGLSSVSCGVIDFVSLFLINGITHNLFISVVMARIISSLCNYLLNRNIVFKAVGSNAYSFAKYYGLVVLILLTNYLILDFFTNVVSLSLLLSKILTESIMFLASYYTQKKFVFSAKKI